MAFFIGRARIGYDREGRDRDSAILPGMPGRQTRTHAAQTRVALVGAGNLAGTLGIALQEAGYSLDQIVSRDQPASLRRARRLAEELGASPVVAMKARIDAEVVWFCVPDGAISAAADSLRGAAEWTGKVALHSSGALTSDELARLRRRGAAVASVHPLMTFVPGSRPALLGVPFAIEGDRHAVQVARALVLQLGGYPISIRKRYKKAYHAWGMFASPLFTALLAASETVAAAAGVGRNAARRRMLPILRQTLANYAAFGAARTFSGPIVRGDVETVKKHLTELRAIPQARAVYVALARIALEDLPTKNRAALARTLKG
jgi:predicted short-subunit dehydrogenase-like oxidoreductase (DUF2520 family)